MSMIDAIWIEELFITLPDAEGCCTFKFYEWLSHEFIFWLHLPCLLSSLAFTQNDLARNEVSDGFQLSKPFTDIIVSGYGQSLGGTPGTCLLHTY